MWGRRRGFVEPLGSVRPSAPDGACRRAAEGVASAERQIRRARCYAGEPERRPGGSIPSAAASSADVASGNISTARIASRRGSRPRSIWSCNHMVFGHIVAWVHRSPGRPRHHHLGTSPQRITSAHEIGRGPAPSRARSDAAQSIVQDHLGSAIWLGPGPGATLERSPVAGSRRPEPFVPPPRDGTVTFTLSPSLRAVVSPTALSGVMLPRCCRRPAGAVGRRL